MEHVLGLLSGTTAFEECEGPENSLLFAVELLQGQADVEEAGVQECTDGDQRELITKQR